MDESIPGKRFSSKLDKMISKSVIRGILEGSLD